MIAADLKFTWTICLLSIIFFFIAEDAVTGTVHFMRKEKAETSDNKGKIIIIMIIAR